MPRPWLVGLLLGFTLLIGTNFVLLNNRLQRLERHAVLNMSDLCLEFITLPRFTMMFAGSTGPTIVLQALPCHLLQETRR